MNKDYILYPNQKLLQIEKVTEGCNTYSGERAQKVLSKNGFQLYMYLVFRRTNKYWALSKVDVVNSTSLSVDTYQLAVNELIEKGYFIPHEIIKDGKRYSKDTYFFLEDPSGEVSKYNKTTEEVATTRGAKRYY